MSWRCRPKQNAYPPVRGMTSKSTSGAPIRIQDWLKTARQQLAESLARSPAGQTFSGQQPDEAEVRFTAGLEAQLLASSVLHHTRAWLAAHPETELTREQRQQLDRLLEQRLSGVPLPYLLGHWEFYGLDFEVTPDVLIPRPETELLVEHALSCLKARPGLRAADVGTGSGCIAISLLKHAPNLRMLTTDRSWQALQVARRNADRHAVLYKLALVQGDLLSAAAGPFDLVCANLPYIPRQSLETLEVARYEPIPALDGGEDGLDAIRGLIQDAHRWLAPGGTLLLEMQYDQGEAIQKLAGQFIDGSRTRVLLDLAGKPRLVEVIR